MENQHGKSDSSSTTMKKKQNRGEKRKSSKQTNKHPLSPEIKYIVNITAKENQGLHRQSLKNKGKQLRVVSKARRSYKED